MPRQQLVLRTDAVAFLAHARELELRFQQVVSRGVGVAGQRAGDFVVTLQCSGGLLPFTTSLLAFGQRFQRLAPADQVVFLFQDLRRLAGACQRRSGFSIVQMQQRTYLLQPRVRPLLTRHLCDRFTMLEPFARTVDIAVTQIRLRHRRRYLCFALHQPAVPR